MSPTARTAPPGDARGDATRRHCPHKPIDSGAAGAPKLTFADPDRDPRLLKGYVAVRVVVTGIFKGKPVTQTYAVYQQRGSVLSGITASAEAVPPSAS